MINVFIAQTIEDKISWGRVIARNADLYGRRSRHWSTTDPIQLLVGISMVLLLLMIGGLNYEPPPIDQALDWHYYYCGIMLTGCKLVLLIWLALFYWLRISKRMVLFLTIAFFVIPSASAVDPFVERSIDQFKSLSNNIGVVNQLLNRLGGLLNGAASGLGGSTVLRDWNAICVHQRPRSPATNMLDLGVWMAIQNVVEKFHIGNMRHTESLARTVEKAWTEFEPVKLTNVWNHWRMILDLIIDDEGGDRLIESKRGKLYRAPPEEAEVIEEVLEAEETAGDAADEADLDIDVHAEGDALARAEGGAYC